MRRYQMSWGLFALCLFVSLSFMYCGTGSNGGGPGAACQSTQDCDTSQNLECRGKKCRTELPDDPPVAKAEAKPSPINVGDQAQLDASESSDPLGDTLGLLYTWEVSKRPDDSKAEIQKDSQVIATFTPDVAGSYTFKVTVSISRNGKVLKASAETSIEAVLPPNNKPIANAGGDQLVLPGATAQLDGSGSRDPDGGKLTYSWSIKSKPEGSKATISEATDEKPKLTTDEPGKYIINLVVKDERGDDSDADSVTIEALVGADKIPVLTKVAPTEGAAYELEYKITLEGSDFVKGARVKIGTPDFATTWVSDTKLEAKVDLAKVGPGTHSVQVINTNGKGSKELSFKVLGIPAPTLVELSPSQGHLGMEKIVVTAKGTNFIKDQSKVVFETVQLPSRVKSPTEIEFDVDLRSTPLGTYPVKIINPGNQTSNTLNFKVLDKLAKPVLNVLNPPSGVTGTRLEFSVHGVGFGQGALIYFDKAKIGSVRKSRDEVAAVPQLDLTNIKPGLYDVWVKNPDGQDSNKQQFRVRSRDPEPRLDRILPFTLFLGEKTSAVSIYGADFLPGAKVMIGNNEIKGIFGSVSWRSDSYIVATVDLTDASKWTAGDVDAIVINPNGKKSSPFKLSLSHRIPSIDALLPSSWTTKCDTEVEIIGRNFLPKAIVKFGTALTFTPTSTTNKLTYVNDQRLKFKLNTTKMTKGTFVVSVENGPIAKASSNFTLSDEASPTPIVSYVSPQWGRADTKVQLRIQPDFSNTNSLRSLRAGAILELGGKQHPTQCNSTTTYCYSMDGTLDLTGYKPGVYDLVLINPCGVRGSKMSFVVEAAPLPFITKMTPAFARVGDKSKIVFKGGNFTKGATLTWNGKAVPLVYKSDKEYETKDPIDFAGATVGDLDVELKNTNGLSAKTKFSIVPTFIPEIKDVTNNNQKVGPLSDIQITGEGFILSSAVLLDGKKVLSRFVAPTQLLLKGLDTTQLSPGMHTLQVQNGTRKSNLYPIFLDKAQGPTINYLNPSNVIAGAKNSVQVYVYGTGFAGTPNPGKVEIIGPDKKDYSKNFKPTSQYTSFIRADFTVGALTEGKYLFRVINPDKTVSNQVVFTVSPPPPPSLNSLSPPSGFRGNAIQQIKLVGTNFGVKDQVIFNNNVLNPIPVSFSSSSEVTVTVNLSRIKASGDYELYLRRCSGTSCTIRTKALKFKVNDPPCSAVNCGTTLLPANSEKCDTNGGNVCRPKCTSTTDCKNLDSKSSWTCNGGYCK